MKLAVLLVLASVTACGGDDVFEAPPPASCLPGCTGVRTYDAQAYDLHASFDWDSSTLTASEDITLDTSTSGAIVELDAAVKISRVHAADQDLAYIVDPTANTLTVDVTPVGTGSASQFTVEYTAKVDGATSQTSGTSLILSSSTSDDPCQSRVLYTDSEPDRALFWLVTQLDPSDRALWSVDMTIGSDEDVIANGARTSDVTTGAKRTVGYALDKPIPAYMMAFAAGQLEHTDRAAADGVVPLSVWYRRGFVLDPQLTLDDVTTAMKVFNSEIMPYPWDTYSVVLLPYGGGMENATITFNDEFSGQGARDFVLNAHELSHHWFGDWVTMHGFDDVWFKEGMATVLESEAERAIRDSLHTPTAGSAGRLWGTDYDFNPADAVVDDTLHGLGKYTSGPYERAGWMITQIRATVGETAFFAGLRKLLADHALGSATGEQFIRSFQPALTEATVQKLLAALPQFDTPALTATATAAAGSATTISIALTDPGAELIAPVDLAVVDAAGAATVTHVVPGAPVSVTVPAGGYLGVDERDVHPHLYVDFGVTFAQYEPLAALLAPAAGSASPVLAAYTSRSAAQQEKAGNFDALPISSPAQLPAYLASLGSVDARESAVIAACGRGRTDGTWLTAAEPFLETPPVAGFDQGLSACGTVYPKATLEPELTAAIASGTPADLARVEYLISFDYGTDSTTIIGALADSAPTLRLREYAAERLQLAQNGQNGYSHRASHRNTHLRAAPAPAPAPAVR